MTAVTRTRSYFLATVLLVTAVLLAGACGSSPSTPDGTPAVSSCAMGISPAALTVGDGATIASTSVSAPSGCSWTAVSNAPFITLSSTATGSGSSAVSFSVAANATGLARTGTVTIGGQMFTVTQQSCTYSLTPSSGTVGAAGGPASLSVTTQPACTWTAASNSSYIAVTSSATNTSSGTVSVTVQPNTGFQRIGTLTVAGQTVTVTQSGASGFDTCVTNILVCSFNTGCDAAHVGGSGGTAEVNLSAPASCGWAATPTVPWIAVYSTSPVNQPQGTGNGHFGFSVAANTGSAPRSGGFTAGGKLFPIDQDACSTTLSQTSLLVAATGGSATVSLTSSCAAAWAAASNAPFITVTAGGSGTGDGTVTLSVAANTGAARIGTVTIAGQIVTVTQAGQ